MVTDQEVTIIWSASANMEEEKKVAILLNAENPNGILVESNGIEVFIPLHSMKYFYQKKVAQPMEKAEADE